MKKYTEILNDIIQKAAHDLHEKDEATAKKLLGYLSAERLPLAKPIANIEDKAKPKPITLYKWLNEHKNEIIITIISGVAIGLILHYIFKIG